MNTLLRATYPLIFSEMVCDLRQKNFEPAYVLQVRNEGQARIALMALLIRSADPPKRQASRRAGRSIVGRLAFTTLLNECNRDVTTVIRQFSGGLGKKPHAARG
jgi:hypothetical protein